MKLITAIIKPYKVDAVREALTNIGVQGATMTEVRGFGRQGGHTELYRGAEYKVNFVAKVKLEVAAPDERVEMITRTIEETARSGSTGDGKIFVSELEQVVRIRTGEIGVAAL